MTSLTEQQQELVARNLPIVHWVICDYIHVNPTICGMEYGDLFQEGCLWLCKAASTYKNDGRAQFSTYAKTVVKKSRPDAFDTQVSLIETLSLLDACKKDYDGVTRLGIEALALKLQGMRVTDIAELYQVPPSHVGAWISRSTAKLRRDSKFLKSLL